MSALWRFIGTWPKNLASLDNGALRAKELGFVPRRAEGYHWLTCVAALGGGFGLKTTRGLHVMDNTRL